MEKHYSVLMSVYYKEKAENLSEAIQSMYDQTIRTDDFILVCDGPLNNELDAVISEMQQKFGGCFHVHRLEKNQGLGKALNYGLKQCKNELVARMDSDDISRKERCEKQIDVFNLHPEISICSGTVEEFEKDINLIIGIRRVPETENEIIKYSKTRNPFNHPAVMFKKSSVLKAGGYSEKFHLFEDYYLWIRMLLKGCKGRNIPETILYMRSGEEMYKRRGGMLYAKELLRFHSWMKDNNWITWKHFVCGAIPHAVVCGMPNQMRKRIYIIMHNGEK